MPGMMVFFARPSMLQDYATLFGQQWRHVGIVVQTDDGLKIATFGIKKGFLLDPIEIISSGFYDRVGVATVLTSAAELAALDAFWRMFARAEETVYVYSAAGVGPLLYIASRCPRAWLRRLILLLLEGYCALQAERFKDRPAYVCSTFVWSAVQMARTRSLVVPLSAHPDDPVAYAKPATPLDMKLGRWFCTPTALWDAVSPESRVELDLPERQTDVVTKCASASPGTRATEDRSGRRRALMCGLRQRVFRTVE